MKLVYCWITNYLNIKDQGFNLGSEWIYTTTKDSDSLKIERKKNEKYVDDFFKLDNVGFENVTAIVGENGAGKSNILEYLNYLLSKEKGQDEESTKIDANVAELMLLGPHDGFLIWLDENGKHHIKYDNEKRVIDELDYIEFDNEKNKENYTIFYSPVFDVRYREGPYNKNFSLNVSTNYLIKKDFSTNQEKLRGSFNDIEVFKIAETYRQLLFLNNRKSSTEVSKVLSIPQQLKISPSEVSELSKRLKKSPDVVSILDFYKKEKDLLLRLRKDAEYKDKKKQNTLIRLQILLDCLYSLFVALIYSSQLEARFNGEKAKDKTNFKDAINEVLSISFDENLVYQKPSQLNFVKILETFFDKQTHFNQQNIDNVINAIYSIAVNCDYEANGFAIPTDEALLLLQSYETLINNYTSGRRSRAMTTGFLDFSWRGMSNGEIAFLNLFSRLYSTVPILDGLGTTPARLTLLIDEGELGFHFQWQKEYLKNLISFVPKIFKNKKDPQIHLIFTTHSPVTLSDVPNHHIVFLKKEWNEKGKNWEGKVLSNGEGIKHTFGANIHEILYDSFFMKDGFIGAFATEKINNVFKYLNDELTKKQKENGNYQPKMEDLEKNKLIIRNIDEPLIRVKLEEKLAELEEDDPNAREITRLEDLQKSIEKRLKNLRNNDTNTRES